MQDFVHSVTTLCQIFKNRAILQRDLPSMPQKTKSWTLVVLLSDMESGRLSEQAKKAVSALIKHENLVALKTAKSPASSGSKKELELEGESGENGDCESLVYLVIHFNKISDKISLKPVRMAIPHPFRNAESEDLSVCIITKDPQRFFKDLINPLELTAVTKIVGISKLRSKFKPFEAKRALCSSFDLFAADTRIIPMLPKIIGKTFFEKKKQPVPVDLSSTSPEDVKQEIQEAVQATYFFQTGGSSTSITVGKCLQDPAHIAANIEAVIKQLGKKLPSGLSTIRTIHVKTKDSAALPIYVRDVKEA